MTFTKFKESEKSNSPHYLLIGNPVSHSVSPLMHNTALEYHQIDAEYHAVAVALSEIPSLAAHFNNPNFLGANITIPHKENLLKVVDALTEQAEDIGAINTILKQNSKLIGENTDSYGFAAPLEEYSDEIDLNRAIIFGSGGATKAIIYALREIGVHEIIMVSRRPERYSDADNLISVSYDSWPEYAEESSLIINATPLGMFPNTAASPIKENERELLAEKLCYDIVYNPKETTFLKQAISAGGIPIGGIEMLIYQGAKSFKLWTGKEFPIGLIKMKLDEIFPY